MGSVKDFSKKSGKCTEAELDNFIKNYNGIYGTSDEGLYATCEYYPHATKPVGNAGCYRKRTLPVYA